MAAKQSCRRNIMRELLIAAIKYQSLIFFIGLELLCAYLITRNNAYQSTAFFSSANNLIGSGLEKRSEFQNYMGLTEKNAMLARESALLRAELANLKAALAQSPEGQKIDTALLKRYVFEPAQVISNSYLLENNHLTINKGARHGIRKGMGIITPLGAVGQVNAVSENFSTAFSLLSPVTSVSATLKKSNTLCTVKWLGGDYRLARLTFVARHTKLYKGDTVLTSNFNLVYPQSTPLGVIVEVDSSSSNNYNEADLRLFNDFSSLSYVYVLKDSLKQEQDSLQTVSQK